MDEKSYTMGSRTAWTQMLSLCCKHLGYDDPQSVSWITEREAAITALRTLCEAVGDNDWDEKQHLADIIEKHLDRHLRGTHTYTKAGTTEIRGGTKGE